MMVTLKYKIFLGLIFFVILGLQTLYADDGPWFITPTGTGDCSQASPCSLNTVFAAATNSGTIYFAAGNYTSTDYVVMEISGSQTILGGWDGTATTPIVRNPDVHVTVIDGEDTRGGIEISDGKSVVIDGITIANCLLDDVGAGLFVENSTSLILKNVIFSDNYAENLAIDYIHGGAAYIQGGTLNIENCSFINNAAQADISGYGGALAIFETNTTIRSSIFRENRAYTNSVLKFKGVSSTSLNTLLIEDSTFSNHGLTAPHGYEIIKIENADIEAYNNIFTQNLSHRGDLIEICCSRLVFASNTISKNSSQKIAALSLNRITNLQLLNNLIVDNNSTSSAEDFPAIYTTASNGLFAHNTIANNNTDFALLMGCGIALAEPMDDISLVNNIIVSDSIIDPNSVGLYVAEYAEVDVNSTLWVGPVHMDGSGIINDTNNFVGSPDFIDAANGDYHIGANSAAKDKGAISGINIDIDGDSRPQGNGYDIGADEFEVIDSSVSPSLIMYLLKGTPKNPLKSA